MLRVAMIPLPSRPYRISRASTNIRYRFRQLEQKVMTRARNGFFGVLIVPYVCLCQLVGLVIPVFVPPAASIPPVPVMVLAMVMVIIVIVIGTTREDTEFEDSRDYHFPSLDPFLEPFHGEVKRGPGGASKSRALNDARDGRWRRPASVRQLPKSWRRGQTCPKRLPMAGTRQHLQAPNLLEPSSPLSGQTAYLGRS